VKRKTIIHARHEASPGASLPHLQPEPPEPPGSLESLEEDGGPGEIVARPDGYHWIAVNGRQEFGPFETLELAQSFRDGYDEGAPAPAETLPALARSLYRPPMNCPTRRLPSGTATDRVVERPSFSGPSNLAPQ